MIRFILKRKVLDRWSGAEYSTHYTIDVDVPELQSALLSGGMAQEAYEVHELVGVEVLAAKEQPHDR